MAAMAPSLEAKILHVVLNYSLTVPRTLETCN